MKYILQTYSQCESLLFYSLNNKLLSCDNRLSITKFLICNSPIFKNFFHYWHSLSLCKYLSIPKIIEIFFFSPKNLYFSSFAYLDLE